MLVETDNVVENKRPITSLVETDNVVSGDR